MGGGVGEAQAADGAALQELVVDDADGILIGIWVAGLVAGAEHEHLFAGQVDFVQLVEDVLPVVLQFAHIPSRDAGDDHIVFFKVFWLDLRDVFIGGEEILAQGLFDLFGDGFGFASASSVEKRDFHGGNGGWWGFGKGCGL